MFTFKLKGMKGKFIEEYRYWIPANATNIKKVDGRKFQNYHTIDVKGRNMRQLLN